MVLVLLVDHLPGKAPPPHRDDVGRSSPSGGILGSVLRHRHGYPPASSRAGSWLPVRRVVQCRAGASTPIGEKERLSFCRHGRLRGQHAQRGLDDGRIKLRAGTAHQFGARALLRATPLIGPVGRHGLIGLGDPNDTRGAWNALSSQPVGIAAAIPVLVMVRHRGHQRVQERTHLQDLRAECRVLLDERALGRGERASLVQESIGQCDLA